MYATNYVSNEKDVHLVVLENRTKGRIRFNFHGPVLMAEGYHPGSYLAIHCGQVCFHEGRLVGQECLVACVQVRFCGEDNEVGDALVEGVVAGRVGPRVGPRIQGGGVEAGLVLREIVPILLTQLCNGRAGRAPFMVAFDRHQRLRKKRGEEREGEQGEGSKASGLPIPFGHSSHLDCRVALDKIHERISHGRCTIIKVIGLQEERGTIM